MLVIDDGPKPSYHQFETAAGDELRWERRHDTGEFGVLVGKTDVTATDVSRTERPDAPFRLTRLPTQGVPTRRSIDDVGSVRVTGLEVDEMVSCRVRNPTSERPVLVVLVVLVDFDGSAKTVR